MSGPEYSHLYNQNPSLFKLLKSNLYGPFPYLRSRFSPLFLFHPFILLSFFSPSSTAHVLHLDALFSLPLPFPFPIALASAPLPVSPSPFFFPMPLSPLSPSRGLETLTVWSSPLVWPPHLLDGPTHLFFYLLTACLLSIYYLLAAWPYFCFRSLYLLSV